MSSTIKKHHKDKCGWNRGSKGVREVGWRRMWLGLGGREDHLETWKPLWRLWLLIAQAFILVSTSSSSFPPTSSFSFFFPIITFISKTFIEHVLIWIIIRVYKFGSVFSKFSYSHQLCPKICLEFLICTNRCIRHGFILKKIEAVVVYWTRTIEYDCLDCCWTGHNTKCFICTNSLHPSRNPVKWMLLFFHFINEENEAQKD